MASSSTATTTTTASSERVCQFFLRGRCQRENCEFRHDAERLKAIQQQQGGTSAKGAAPAQLCRLFQAGACKFRTNCRFRHEKGPVDSSSGFTAPYAPRTLNTTAFSATVIRKPTAPSSTTLPSHKNGEEDSDDDASFLQRPGSDDDESIASGFTDVHTTTAVTKPEIKKAEAKVTPTVAASGNKDKKGAEKDDSVSMPPPPSTPLTRAVAIDKVSEPKKQSAAVEKPEAPVPTAAEQTRPKNEKSIRAKSSPKNYPEASSSKSTQESSPTDNSMASPAANETTVTKPTDAKALSRRTKVANKKSQEAKKDIRRDSKGFENFEDYFSESEPEASPLPAAEATLPRTRKNSGKKEPAKESNDSIQSVPDEDSLDVTPKLARTTRGSVQKPTKVAVTQDEGKAKVTPEKMNKKAVDKVAKTKSKDPEGERDNGVQDSETIENIMHFIQDESTNNKGEKEKVKQLGKSETVKETSVAAIFGSSSSSGRKESWTTADKNKKKSKEESARKKSSAYDLEVDDADLSGATPFVSAKRQRVTAVTAAPKSASAKKRNLLTKKEGVTKIGNNTYFYTGPKGSKVANNEDDDDDILVGGYDDDEDMLISNAADAEDSPPFVNSASKRGRKPRTSTAASSTKVDTTPVSSGKNNQQEEPEGSATGKPGESGKRRGRKPKSVTVTPTTTPAPQKPRNSIEVRPDDSELPVFDPNKFKPGYIPPIVKKGDAEYMVIVSGVKDTGLCGKYWSDLDTLPARRRRSNALTSEEGSSDSPQPSRKESSEKGESSTPSRRGRPKRKQQDNEESSSAQEPFAKEEVSVTKKPKTAAKAAVVPKPPMEGSENLRRKMAEEMSVNIVHSDFEKTKENEAMEKAARRFSSIAATTAAKEIAAAVAESSQPTPKRATRGPPPVASPAAAAEARETSSMGAEPQTPQALSGANRSVSCVADTSTQREVVVECFAPYDDHRWVNIGKERDGMNPDAVQYARALRPPYHLLSFLRIKGYSTKGMSCTDKNTMVFVVLEGEITVVLHTTQFVARKGDSFYIPPKNYYNLINQKVREAELSLIQFQYDGPLPTVSGGSQSGHAAAAQRSQQQSNA